MEQNQGGTNNTNLWKQSLKQTPPPSREWKPLSGYVLPREKERAQYAAIPSQYK